MRDLRFTAALALFLVLAPEALSSTGPKGINVREKQRLTDQLGDIRSEVIRLEQELIEAKTAQAKAKSNVKRIQQLIKLQQEERVLAKQRLGELESTVRELESRRQTLNDRIAAHRKSIRQFLVALERSISESDSVEKTRNFRLHEREREEAPRRRLLANMTSRSLKEIEILKVDLVDADHLETKIQEEKQRLAYLFQDLNEKESLLELNRQIQADLLRRNRMERVSQLEDYRKLKASETQLEQLIGQFNARLELERANEAEKVASKAMSQGVFARMKGRLDLPVQGGRVVSAFGRAFDPKSRLYIFKKGIEIESAPREAVRAISAGKVVFSGELPDYGQVTIIDHGEQYYSLCAHLGGLQKREGDSVAAGDKIGETDDSGTPVYFEIRSRNVPVNPLQWVSS